MGLRERFIEKNLSNIEQINKIVGKLEKSKDKESLVKLLSSISIPIIKDAIANGELPISFLLRKIKNLTEIGDYYMASEFSKELIKKIKDIKADKLDTGIEPPKPKEEKRRISAVRKLKILDTVKEDRFDAITKIATKLFNVKISTITLIDENREWHKSTCGINIKEGKRSTSFCGHTILEDNMLIIPNTTKDPRFANNPKVTGKMHLRFYAGVPLLSVDGQKVGTFCLKDTKPKKLTKQDIRNLRSFALWAELEINAHDLGQSLIKLRKSVKRKLGVK